MDGSKENKKKTLKDKKIANLTDQFANQVDCDLLQKLGTCSPFPTWQKKIPDMVCWLVDKIWLVGKNKKNVVCSQNMVGCQKGNLNLPLEFESNLIDPDFIITITIINIIIIIIITINIINLITIIISSESSKSESSEESGEDR